MTRAARPTFCSRESGRVGDVNNGRHWKGKRTEQGKRTESAERLLILSLSSSYSSLISLETAPGHVAGFHVASVPFVLAEVVAAEEAPVPVAADDGARVEVTMRVSASAQ